MQRTSGCWPLWTTWTTLALSIAWTAWTTQAFALVKVGETAPFSLESNVANVRARTWPFCDWHCDSIRGFHNLHIHCGRANPNFFWYPFWANHHVVSLGTVPKYVFSCFDIINFPAVTTSSFPTKQALHTLWLLRAYQQGVLGGRARWIATLTDATYSAHILVVFLVFVWMKSAKTQCFSSGPFGLVMWCPHNFSLGSSIVGAPLLD